MAYCSNAKAFSEQEEFKHLQNLLCTSFRHLHSILDKRESLLSNRLTLIYKECFEAEKEKFCKVEKMRGACDAFLSSLLDTNLLEATTVTLKPIQDQIEQTMSNRKIIKFEYNPEPMELAIAEFGNFITLPNTEIKEYCTQNETSKVDIDSDVTSIKFPARVNVNEPIPGLCGLSYLGNYSQASSVIQCLLHTQPIVDLFSSGSIVEGSKVYFESLKDIFDIIHSGTAISMNPEGNKLYVDDPPTDAYLHLCKLLPCLHGELNAVVENVCIAMPQSSSQDSEVSKLAWNLHSLCNQSIISRTFHGQYKSTTTCVGCNEQSFSFDFFSSVSLSLTIMELDKQDESRNIKFSLVFLNPATKPVIGKIRVLKDARIRDLCLEISDISGIDSSMLVVCDVYSHRFHKIFDHTESITGITERDDIFVYETPINTIDDPNLICLPVYNRELRRTQYSSIGTNYYTHHYLFGIPLILSIPRDTTTYSDLYRICVYFMQRYIDKDNVNGQSIGITPFEFIASGYVPESFDISGYPSDMFKIKLVDVHGSAEMGELKNDGQYLKLSNRSVLALEWNSRQRGLYNETKLRDIGEMDVLIPQFPINLKQCIRYYLRKELLPESQSIDCANCKKKERIYKQNELWILPDYLILHLERFKDNNKIYSLLNFPFELDMTEFSHSKDQGQAQYNLYAVCNHHGGVAGGHYTASIKHTDGEWYCFDDSAVSHILYPQCVVTNAAYILFYKRRTC